MNPIQIIQADLQTPQAWRNSGGQTRELLVWPAHTNSQGNEPVGNTPPGSLGGTAFCAGKGGAHAVGGGHGAERSAAQTTSENQTSTPEWKLRISRADITQSGPFSAFEGVQRCFVVLSGNGVVLHMPTPDGHTQDHTLLPGHTPLHFDGGLAPGCTLIDGPTQDLNLMARGGSAGVLPVQHGVGWTSEYAMCGIYTASGGTWIDGHQTRTLAAHTLLWLPETGIPSTPMHFESDTTQPPHAWWLGFTPEPNP